MGNNIPLPPEDFTCRVCKRKRDEVMKESEGLLIEFCHDSNSKKHRGEINCGLCSKIVINSGMNWKTGTNLQCNGCNKEGFVRLVNMHCDECFTKKFCHHMINLKKNNCAICGRKWNWREHFICSVCELKEHHSVIETVLAPPRDYARQFIILGSISTLVVLAILLILSSQRGKKN